MSTKVQNKYIPKTRIDSYRELILSGQKVAVEKVCIAALEDHYQSGLTRPQISELSGKKEQCLTGALLDLVKQGKIIVSGVRINYETNRNNQVYKLVSNE